MSDDELFAMIVSMVVVFFTWGPWYRTLAFMPVRRSSGSLRRLLGLVPPACLAGIFVMLKTTAASDVRDSGLYLFFYVLFGAAWLGTGIPLLKVLDLHARDDAMERNNPAAIAAVCAALAGLSACYSGANIGEGPGWWCVLFAGGLATLVWLALLLFYQVVTDAAETITVERDINSAIRFGGLAIGTGILCGRGAAGDWTSFHQTVVEFLDAWPVVILLAIACVLDRTFTSSDRSDEGPSGEGGLSVASVLCALVYIASSVYAIVYFLPPPPHSIGPQ